MFDTILGFALLATNAAVASHSTTTAAIPEATLYEDSIVPGPGCPDWNGLTDADGYGGIYTIHCNAMVTGTNMIMVGQSDGNPYVPVMSCLATCDRAVDCYGAFITADGQCQIVTGTGYGVIPFPGYSAYVRDNPGTKKRSLVHNTVIEPIERAVNETKTADDATRTFTYPPYASQTSPGCFWLNESGPPSLHRTINRANQHIRPTEYCTTVGYVDGCSKEHTPSSPTEPCTDVPDYDGQGTPCDESSKLARSVTDFGPEVAARGPGDGELMSEAAASRRFSNAEFDSKLTTRSFTGEGLRTERVAALPPSRRHREPRSYPISSECENKQCNEYLYVCTYVGTEIAKLNLLASWTSFCEAGVGQTVGSQGSYNQTVSLDGGHTLLMGVQNNLWNGETYLFEEDSCQEAAKAILESCSPDQQGSQGGYVWYYYKSLVWFVGIDGNLPGKFCLGAC